MRNMYIPKRYGQSRVERCPFCTQHATTQNSQGVPVCNQHKSAEITDWKCACGEYIDVRQGKFGTFFSCLRCGNISMAKAAEMNEETAKKSVKKEDSERKTPKESTFRSDELDFI
ncbi:MAG: hypothetical protein V1725_00905 [archaeon]